MQLSPRRFGVAVSAFAVFVLAHPVAAQQIRFGVTRVGIATPALVALEIGAFEGLDVRTIEVKSGGVLRDALIAGEVDLGMMTDTVFATVVARGIPIRAIALSGYGGDRRTIVVRPDSPIKGVEDLVGKKVGVQVGSGLHAAFQKVLRAHGLEESQLEIKNVEFGNVIAALEAKSIDAGVTIDPFYAVGEDRGACRVMFRMGEYSHAPYLLVVRNDFAAAHPDLVARFLERWIEAVEFVRHNPGRVAQLISEKFVAIGFSDVTPKVAGAVLGDVTWTYEISEKTEQALVEEAQRLHRTKRISTLPDVSRFIDRSFLRRALRSRS